MEDSKTTQQPDGSTTLKKDRASPSTPDFKIPQASSRPPSRFSIRRDSVARPSTPGDAFRTPSLASKSQSRLSLRRESLSTASKLLADFQASSPERGLSSRPDSTVVSQTPSDFTGSIRLRFDTTGSDDGDIFVRLLVFFHQNLTKNTQKPKSRESLNFFYETWSIDLITHEDFLILSYQFFKTVLVINLPDLALNSKLKNLTQHFLQDSSNSDLSKISAIFITLLINRIYSQIQFKDSANRLEMLQKILNILESVEKEKNLEILFKTDNFNKWLKTVKSDLYTFGEHLETHLTTQTTESSPWLRNYLNSMQTLISELPYLYHELVQPRPLSILEPEKINLITLYHALFENYYNIHTDELAVTISPARARIIHDEIRTVHYFTKDKLEENPKIEQLQKLIHNNQITTSQAGFYLDYFPFLEELYAVAHHQKEFFVLNGPQYLRELVYKKKDPRFTPLLELYRTTSKEYDLYLLSQHTFLTAINGEYVDLAKEELSKSTLFDLPKFDSRIFEIEFGKAGEGLWEPGIFLLINNPINRIFTDNAKNHLVSLHEFMELGRAVTLWTVNLEEDPIIDGLLLDELREKTVVFLQRWNTLITKLSGIFSGINPAKKSDPQVAYWLSREKPFKERAGLSRTTCIHINALCKKPADIRVIEEKKSATRPSSRATVSFSRSASHLRANSPAPGSSSQHLPVMILSTGNKDHQDFPRPRVRKSSDAGQATLTMPSQGLFTGRRVSLDASSLLSSSPSSSKESSSPLSSPSTTPPPSEGSAIPPPSSATEARLEPPATSPIDSKNSPHISASLPAASPMDSKNGSYDIEDAKTMRDISQAFHALDLLSLGEFQIKLRSIDELFKELIFGNSKIKVLDQLIFYGQKLSPEISPLSNKDFLEKIKLLYKTLSKLKQNIWFVHTFKFQNFLIIFGKIETELCFLDEDSDLTNLKKSWEDLACVFKKEQRLASKKRLNFHKDIIKSICDSYIFAFTDDLNAEEEELVRKIPELILTSFQDVEKNILAHFSRDPSYGHRVLMHFLYMQAIPFRFQEERFYFIANQINKLGQIFFDELPQATTSQEKDKQLQSRLELEGHLYRIFYIHLPEYLLNRARKSEELSFESMIDSLAYNPIRDYLQGACVKFLQDKFFGIHGTIDAAAERPLLKWVFKKNTALCKEKFSKRVSNEILMALDHLLLVDAVLTKDYFSPKRQVKLLEQVMSEGRVPEPDDAALVPSAFSTRL